MASEELQALREELKQLEIQVVDFRTQMIEAHVVLQKKVGKLEANMEKDKYNAIDARTQLASEVVDMKEHMITLENNFANAMASDWVRVFMEDIRGRLGNLEEEPEKKLEEAKHKKFV